MKKLLTYSLFLMFLTQYSTAQDSHLSQYYAAPLYLNPSMTGMFSGKWRIHAHFRNQWSSVIKKAYLTSVLAYDIKVNRWAFGIFAMNNRAGSSNFNIHNLHLSASYDLPFGNSGNHHIFLGLQGGAIQKSFAYSKLFFGNQYLPSDGGTIDPTLPSNEVFENTSMLIPDVNFGIMYFLANSKARMNPFLGFSAFHLSEPNESFLGYSSKLPRKYILHGGAKVKLSPAIQITPQVLLMQQGNNREITGDLLAHIQLNENDQFLLIGGAYRYLDAGIAHMGIRFGNITSRISYDINTSTLQSFSNKRGGFELSLTYIHAGSEKIAKPNLLECPRL